MSAQREIKWSQTSSEPPVSELGRRHFSIAISRWKKTIAFSTAGAEPGEVQLTGVVHLPFGSTSQLPTLVRIHPKSGDPYFHLNRQRNPAVLVLEIDLFDPGGQLAAAAADAMAAVAGGLERFVYLHVDRIGDGAPAEGDAGLIESVQFAATQTLARAPDWSWSWSEEDVGAASDVASRGLKAIQKIQQQWIWSIVWRSLVGLAILGALGAAESNGQPTTFMLAIFVTWVVWSAHTWSRQEAQIRDAAMRVSLPR